jgi:hypothetical protein
MPPLPAADLPQRPNSSTCRERGFLRRLALLLGPIALGLEGCSTRPREFTATLAVPPRDAVAYEAAFARCRTLVAQARKSNFGANAASATLGTAAGTAVATTAVGPAVGASISSAVGGTGATVGGAVIGVAAPIFGVLVGFRFSRLLRSSNKERLQDRLVLCLSVTGSKNRPLAYVKEVGKVVRSYRRAQPSAAASMAVAAPFKA